MHALTTLILDALLLPYAFSRRHRYYPLSRQLPILSADGLGQSDEVGLWACSVGGLDYGTVRAGAFMGLRMLSEVADARHRPGSHRSSAAAKPHSPGLANGGVHPQPPPIGARPYTFLLCRNKLGLPPSSGMWAKACAGRSENKSTENGILKQGTPGSMESRSATELVSCQYNISK